MSCNLPTTCGYFEFKCRFLKVNFDIQILGYKQYNILNSFIYHLPKLAGSHIQPKKESLSIEIFKAANLQYKNTKGRTILYEAVSQYCSLNLFRELLRLGADISLRDGAGETVRDYAKRRGRDVYVECIDKRGKEVVGKNDTETVMGWLLNDYNHILDVVKADAWLQHRVYEDVKLIEIRKLLKSSTTMQVRVDRPFIY